MAYENSNQNQQYVEINTSTSSLSFFDVNGALMKLSFYDEFLNVTYTPVEDNGSGGKTYLKDNRVNLKLLPERVETFLKIINKKFLPEYVKGVKYSGGIFTNKDSSGILQLRVGEDGNPELVFISNINPENRTSNKVHTFIFRKSHAIENYDPKSGEFVLEDGIDSQLYVFIRTMQSFVDNIGGITGHMNRYTNRYSNSKTFETLNAIALKLGITEAAAPTNSYSSNSNRPAVTSFNKQNSTSVTNTNIDEGELDDIINSLS